MMWRLFERVSRPVRAAGRAVWVPVLAAGVVAGAVVVVEPVVSDRDSGAEVADGGSGSSGLSRTFGADGVGAGGSGPDGPVVGAAPDADADVADDSVGKSKSWVTEMIEGAVFFAGGTTSPEITTVGSSPEGTEVARPGDKINWTVTYQPPVGVTPEDVDVRALIPEETDYDDGSYEPPLNWDQKFSGNGVTWGGSMPANPVGFGAESTAPGRGELFDVDFVSAPLQGRVNTASGGDGYTPIMVTNPDGEDMVLAQYHLSLDTLRTPSSPDLFCILQRTGAPCPGVSWPVYFSSEVGPLGSGVNDITGEDTASYVIDGYRVFYPAMKRESPTVQSAGIGCFNYATWTNCGYWAFDENLLNATVGDHFLGTIGTVRVGNNLYSVISYTNPTDGTQWRNTIGCLNIVTDTLCSPVGGFPMTSGQGQVVQPWIRSSLVTHNNRLYWFQPNGTRMMINCWNTITQAPCGGAWGSSSFVDATITTSGNSLTRAVYYPTTPDGGAYRHVFLQYNSAHQVTGVCSAGYVMANMNGGASGLFAALNWETTVYGGLTTCLDLSGNKTGQRWWLQGTLRWSPIVGSFGSVAQVPHHLYSAQDGNTFAFWSYVIANSYTYLDTRDGQLRTIFADSVGDPLLNNRMSCHNWTTASPCDWSGAGNGGYTGARLYLPGMDGRGIYGYGFSHKDNCIYGLNHAALLFSMDAVNLSDVGNGIPCRAITQEVTVEAVPSCAAPAPPPWGVVRVTGFLNNEVSQATVTVEDINGTPVPGYIDRTVSFNGSRVANLDISAIPPTGNTATLTARFHGRYSSSTPFEAPNPPEIRIMTAPAPMDMCYSSIIPAVCDLVGTTIRNTAALTGDAGVVPGNAFHDIYIAANPACVANVTITKNDSQTFTYTEAEGTYRITVTNPGPGPSLHTTVTDTLPDYVNLNGAPTTTAGSCSVAGKTVTCDLGRRNAGSAPVHVDIPYRMSLNPPHPGPIVNTAQVCHDETLIEVCHQASDSNPVRINRAPNGTIGPFRAHEYNTGTHTHFTPGAGMHQTLTVPIDTLTDEDGDPINYNGATIVAGGGNPAHSHASIVGGQLRFQIPTGTSTQETVYVRVCDAPGARYPIPGCRAISTIFHINRAPVGDDTVEISDIPRTGGEKSVLQWFWDPNLSPDGSQHLGLTGGATITFAGGGSGPIPVVINEPGNPYDGEQVATVSINGAGNLVFDIDEAKRDADPDLIGPANFQVRICDTGIPGLAGVACRLINVQYGFGAIGDKRPT